MIKLYGFDACSPCKQIQRLLDKFGIEYEYHDVIKENTAITDQLYPILVIDKNMKFEGLSQDLVKYIRKLGKEYKAKQ